MRKSLTYQDSGVSIDRGNALVKRIAPMIKATARAGSGGDFGGFGGVFDLKAAGFKDPLLVSGTDGVGTKLMVAKEAGIHNSVGIDLVAMCVNDIVVQGAEPLYFLDYFACGLLELEVTEAVVQGIAEGCKQAGCALIGGETAEMPGMYDAGEYDLAGFAVGAVERDQLLPRKDEITGGDVVIGLASSGLHSNGFSLIRSLIEHKNMGYDDFAPFAQDKPLGEALLEPTRIYVKSCLELVQNVPVKALAHITGGGLTENLPRVLPKKTQAVIDCHGWEVSPLYKWIIGSASIEAEEILRTFNAGIGMVAVVGKEHVGPALKLLQQQGERAYAVGEIAPHDADEPVVTYENLGAFSVE